MKPSQKTIAEKLSSLEQHLSVNETSALDGTSYERMGTYLELLQKWTKKVDLVSVASDEVQIDRHIVDSVAAHWMIKKHLNVSKLESCIDVGSGAGLPGLIFAILEPSSKLYLCEPRERRVMFLHQVVKKLDLKNVNVLGMRSESIELENLNDQKVSFITARAVGDDMALVNLAKKVLRSKGAITQLVGPSYKGAQGYEASSLESYTLPFGGSERKLAIWTQL